VGGGLYCLGVPNAAMWGMIVAVLNFVPYFGPVAGVFLLATIGLLSFDTLWQALLPPAWYLLFHLLETNLITPVLLGRRFTINPVVIFVSLIFWMWLWGVPGALLSVPISGFFQGRVRPRPGYCQPSANCSPAESKPSGRRFRLINHSRRNRPERR